MCRQLTWTTVNRNAIIMSIAAVDDPVIVGTVDQRLLVTPTAQVIHHLKTCTFKAVIILHRQTPSPACRTQRSYRIGI